MQNIHVIVTALSDNQSIFFNKVKQVLQKMEINLILENSECLNYNPEKIYYSHNGRSHRKYTNAEQFSHVIVINVLEDLLEPAIQVDHHSFLNSLFQFLEEYGSDTLFLHLYMQLIVKYQIRVSETRFYPKLVEKLTQAQRAQLSNFLKEHDLVKPKKSPKILGFLSEDAIRNSRQLQDKLMPEASPLDFNI